MKQPQFLHGLSNVQRFLDGVKTLQERGAEEANWLVVKGVPGFGKTNTIGWYAVQKPSVFLMAKPDWTSNWMVEELAIKLGLKPRNRTKDMYGAVCEEIIKQLERHGDFALVVDEGDHAARTLRVLETLRSITDMTKAPLIFAGMKDIDGHLLRYPQVHSRICKIVEFVPATLKDVRAMCTAFSDAKIADDMVARILKRTGGNLRKVKNAIAFVDAYAKRARGEVTADGFGNRPLLNDDRDTKSDGDE